MAYHTSEYRREEDRDNKTGGWRSWFGLGDNKERDEDRGYSYSNTTTYRNPTTGYSAPHPERSGYPTYGSRGGYGYTTSDEVTRGPSWNTDRDYTTRAGYGTTGDRDVYYKAETRTYGGDRDTYGSRPTGDYTTPYRRDYTPEYPTSRPTEYPTTRPSEYPTSRTYGFSADRETTTRPYYGERSTPSRAYGGYSSNEYPTTTSSRYPVTGEREFSSTSRYNTEYPTTTSRYTSEYPTGRGYGFSGETSSRFDRDYPTSGQRSYGYESRPYTSGYSGDRDYTRSSYSTRY